MAIFDRKSVLRHKQLDRKEKFATRANIRDAILGFQDGAVNTLGLVLGVAGAVASNNIVLISGLVTTFAESISMAAVAYTSTKAAREFYEGKRKKEIMEMKEVPEIEEDEIRQIYHRKGFRGKQLEGIVKKIISNKRRWLKVMMEEELRLFPEDYDKPGKSAILVGVSAVIGSLIPIIPFFFLTVKNGMIAALGASVAALFLVGVVKARMTEMNWKKSGLELAIIGTLAALVGFGIGKLLGGIYG